MTAGEPIVVIIVVGMVVVFAVAVLAILVGLEVIKDWVIPEKIHTPPDGW